MELRTLIRVEDLVVLGSPTPIPQGLIQRQSKTRLTDRTSPRVRSVFIDASKRNLGRSALFYG